jgi:hypothetical protein
MAGVQTTWSTVQTQANDARSASRSDGTDHELVDRRSSFARAFFVLARGRLQRRRRLFRHSDGRAARCVFRPRRHPKPRSCSRHGGLVENKRSARSDAPEGRQHSLGSLRTLAAAQRRGDFDPGRTAGQIPCRRYRLLPRPGVPGRVRWTMRDRDGATPHDRTARAPRLGDHPHGKLASTAGFVDHLRLYMLELTNGSPPLGETQTSLLTDSLCNLLALAAADGVAAPAA